MTSTTPAGCAGLVTTIVVVVLETMVAAVPPKVTDVTQSKAVPVIVTVVPPVLGPLVGETLRTIGAVGR
jgi:hypothetical protein